jgi:hypothetical protein
MKKRRPIAYLFQQKGYAEHREFFRFRKEAEQEAQYCRWLGQPSTITPLYPGKPLKVKP